METTQPYIGSIMKLDELKKLFNLSYIADELNLNLAMVIKIFNNDKLLRSLMAQYGDNTVHLKLYNQIKNREKIVNYLRSKII